MCAELGLPDGVREGSDESGAVFRGEVDWTRKGSVAGQNPMEPRNSFQMRKTRVYFALVLV